MNKIRAWVKYEGKKPAIVWGRLAVMDYNPYEEDWVEVEIRPVRRKNK